jgi:DNA-damage-inducible protein J
MGGAKRYPSFDTHQPCLISYLNCDTICRYRDIQEITMATTTMVHVRVDDETKSQATEALAAMGLSVSDAVRIFLKRVVAEQAMPLELKVPNAETRAAMEESRAIIRAHRARFLSAAELFDDLANEVSVKANAGPIGVKRSGRN